MPAEADFVISGTIDPRRRKPEGPFRRLTSVTTVSNMISRSSGWITSTTATEAIWPFTSVGPSSPRGGHLLPGN